MKSRRIERIGDKRTRRSERIKRMNSTYDCQRTTACRQVPPLMVKLTHCDIVLGEPACKFIDYIQSFLEINLLYNIWSSLRSVDLLWAAVIAFSNSNNILTPHHAITSYILDRLRQVLSSGWCGHANARGWWRQKLRYHKGQFLISILV